MIFGPGCFFPSPCKPSRGGREPGGVVRARSSHPVTLSAWAVVLALTLVPASLSRAQAQETAVTFFGTPYAFAIPAGYQLRKRYDTSASEIAIFDAADDAVRLTFTATKILKSRPEKNTCLIDGKQFETVPYTASTDVDVTVCRLLGGGHVMRLVRFEACGPACTLYLLIADRRSTPDLPLVAALEQSVARMGR